MANLWDRLIVLIGGEHICILGPRASGKTTLYDYLELGTVYGAREQTVAPTPRDVARNRDYKLNIRRGFDTPGSDVHYAEWKRILDPAKIVFYLFDAGLARTSPEYGQRISDDSKRLKEWGVDGKSVYLLGTHADQDEKLAATSFAEYRDGILDLDVLHALRARVAPKGVGVGSLNTDDSAKKLLDQAMFS